jgi:hypothetical protein
MNRKGRTAGKSTKSRPAKVAKRKNAKAKKRVTGGKSSPRTGQKKSAKTVATSKMKRARVAGAKSTPRTGERSGAKTVVASKPKPARGQGPIQKRGGDPEPRKRKIHGERDTPVRPPQASDADADLLRFGRQRRW